MRLSQAPDFFYVVTIRDHTRAWDRWLLVDVDEVRHQKDIGRRPSNDNYRSWADLADEHAEASRLRAWIADASLRHNTSRSIGDGSNERNPNQG